MTERKAFRLTGTKAELESFLRSLEYTPEITVLSTSINDAGPDWDDSAFGQLDVIEMVVHFSIAIGAHATWDALRSQFEIYRNGRRHLSLEEVTESPDEGTAEQPGDGEARA